MAYRSANQLLQTSATDPSYPCQVNTLFWLMFCLGECKKDKSLLLCVHHLLHSGLNYVKMAQPHGAFRNINSVKLTCLRLETFWNHKISQVCSLTFLSLLVFLQALWTTSQVCYPDWRLSQWASWDVSREPKLSISKSNSQARVKMFSEKQNWSKSIKGVSKTS